MIEANVLYANDNFDFINSTLKTINEEINDSKPFVFNSNAWYVIVQENITPVGLGTLVKICDKYYITGVYVLKNSRHNYYGDLIVKMLLDKGFKLNAKQIYINSIPTLKNFFSKIGFNEISESEMVINEDGIHKCNH